MKKVIVWVALFLVSVGTQAKPLYVKTDGVDAASAGNSWNTPFKTVGYAIQRAAAGDVLYVASGVYTETWGNLKGKVSLYGGFKGTETSETEREVKSGGKPYDFVNQTVITVSGPNVFGSTASYDDVSAFFVDGFTFQDCVSNGSLFTARGGATVQKCRFVNNTLNVSSSTVVGASNLMFLYVTDHPTAIAKAFILDCLFERNTNHQNQNILGVSTGNTSLAVVERVEFVGNATVLATGSTNANILLTGGVSPVSIRNCLFYDNSSRQAVLSTSLNTEVINTLIYNNSCGTNNVLLGGSMYNSMVVNNTSRFCFNNQNSKLYNSVVVGNTSAGLAQNTNITAQTVKNCVVEKSVPTSGIYEANIILETAPEAKFMTPTTFVGIAKSETEKAEYNACNWALQSSSPLINKGSSSWFKETLYGALPINNKDYSQTHVRYYGTKTDIHALESDKNNLSITVGGNGTIPTDLADYYATGEIVKMSATPQRGYEIENWLNELGESLSTSAEFDYTMPATNVQLSVSFRVASQSYDFTLASSIGGKAEIVGEVFSSYFRDEKIEMKATAALGYRFENWTDDLGTVLSSDPNYVYTMPARKATVTANFVLKTADADNAHQFDFEGLTVNPQWKTVDGTLSLTEDRSQTGTQSLCWTTAPQLTNTLKIDLKETYKVDALGNATNTCYFTFYNKDALLEGTLQVRFLDSNGVELCETTLLLNFSGWREFERIYAAEFKSPAKNFKQIKFVEFVLKNPEQKAISVYFDRVNLETTVGKNRVMSDWNAKDASIFSAYRLLTNYASIIDPTLPYTTPTAAELQDLETVKSRYAVSPRQGDAESARTFVKNLNIVRNSDGSVKGPLVPLREQPLFTADQIQTICTRLEALGYAANESESDKALFNNYMDYLLDQGLLYRVVPISSSDYPEVRRMGVALTRVLGACQTERQSVEWSRFVYWIMSYGHVHRSNYITSQNSDLIYNYIEHYTATSAHIKNKTIAVRELKGMKRYLDRAAEITPGGCDLLKPDGTGFHHATHYQHYMYAYIGWVKVWRNMTGTSFRPEAEAYESFKKAAKTMLLFTTRGGSANFSANSVGGRNPFAGGNRSQLGLSQMKDLSVVGGDIYKKASDEDLDAFNTYMFDANSSPIHDGYYAFNWSPAGVYRHGNWVATMRAPTTKFWGTEIYDKRNRFGRFQSHGTLEVLYNDQATPSGYPSGRNLGSWDWNMVPGGTVVHYTDWTEMLPGRTLARRFDQNTITKDFAGALPFENSGVFASDFDQSDDWGGVVFAKTGLSFKKSVFAFDGKLISLGSNVTSTNAPANTGVTATNLFQSFEPTVAPNVNGTLLARQDNVNKDYQSGLWMLSSEGTGYYVPKGNDGLKVYYGTQSAPFDDGSNMNKMTPSVAAKAYINHGVKPTDKKYHFVVIPAANAQQMATAAQQIGETGGELYTINNQDATLHSLTYKSSNTTAYAFFEATKEELTFGNVLKSQSEMLLMEKTVKEGHLSYAVCNPNLRPASAAGGWDATPTNTSITVKGVWFLASAASKNVVVNNDGINTTVTLTLEKGMPIYFELDKTPSSIPDSPVSSNSKVWVENRMLHVVSDQMNTVAIFQSSGAQHSFSASAFNHTISLPQGVYFVRIQNEKGIAVSKIVIP